LDFVSVNFSNYQLQINFPKDFLVRVNVGTNKTHIGIINYSSTVQTLTSLNINYILEQKFERVDQAIYYFCDIDIALPLRQTDTDFFIWTLSSTIRRSFNISHICNHWWRKWYLFYQIQSSRVKLIRPSTTLEKLTFL